MAVERPSNRNCNHRMNRPCRRHRRRCRDPSSPRCPFQDMEPPGGRRAPNCRFRVAAARRRKTRNWLAAAAVGDRSLSVPETGTLPARNSCNFHLFAAITSASSAFNEDIRPMRQTMHAAAKERRQ